MKVLSFNIPKPESHSLIYQVDHVPRFYEKLHQHEEIQISIILNGEGDLIVGDSIHHYHAGDIYLIGSRTPHLFKSDNTIEGDSHMISLFFTEKSFGAPFFSLSELQQVQPLFDEMSAGIRVESQREEIKAEFLKMDNASKLDRFIGFLSILNRVASADRTALSSFVYTKNYTENEGVRMSNVMNFAMVEFHRPITLEEIADVANMTPNAFCRYFKQRTNKTFFQLLTEIRLENACTLLRKNKELSISEISDHSGFRNLSNFNRKFRHYKQITPTGYRKMFG